MPLPDWQLEPDEEMWGTPYELEGVPLVDEYGNPIDAVPADPLAPVPGPAVEGAPDQTELDRIFSSPLPQREQRPPPPRQPPPPRSDAPADPLQPGADPPQQ